MLLSQWIDEIRVNKVVPVQHQFVLFEQVSDNLIDNSKSNLQQIFEFQDVSYDS